MDEIQKARINKANAEANGMIWKPKDALQHVIDQIDSGAIDPNKLIIINLDDRIDSEGRKYNVNYNQCGMYSSEIIALLTYAISQFCKEIDQS